MKNSNNEYVLYMVQFEYYIFFINNLKFYRIKEKLKLFVYYELEYNT